jgi:hypothetical protein
VRRIVKAIALVGVIDFALFIAGVTYLGGDALNGYRQGDRFYLGLHSNGPFTEVTRDVFQYSEWHAFTLIVIFALVLIVELAFRFSAKWART